MGEQALQDLARPVCRYCHKCRHTHILTNPFLADGVSRLAVAVFWCHPHTKLLHCFLCFLYSCGTIQPPTPRSRSIHNRTPRKQKVLLITIAVCWLFVRRAMPKVSSWRSGCWCPTWNVLNTQEAEICKHFLSSLFQTNIQTEINFWSKFYTCLFKIYIQMSKQMYFTTI